MKLVEDQRLEKLAGHRCFSDTGFAKVSHLSAHSPHAEDAILVADVGQDRIGVVFDSHANDFVALPIESFGDTHREIPPASNQSNSLRINDGFTHGKFADVGLTSLGLSNVWLSDTGLIGGRHVQLQKILSRAKKRFKKNERDLGMSSSSLSCVFAV
jgi:hypothetical protein